MPLVTFIISTFNRCEVLLRTLGELRHCGLPLEQYEIIVIDNASTDGTAAAMASANRDVRLLPLNENLGSCAKNVGLKHARGEYIVFLDDDSFPEPWSVLRMVRHF